jgi:alkyl hydroperoxide reductase subunit F
MLDAALKTQLASYLERIAQPVDIAAALDDTPASTEMRALLQDIADASPAHHVTESQGGPHRTPSFSINRPGENHGPRFAGLPMGHEFTSLVLALLQVGGYPPRWSRRCSSRSAPWTPTSSSRSMSR